MTEQFPTYSYVCIGGRLRLTGVGISPLAVRAVWDSATDSPCASTACFGRNKRPPSAAELSRNARSSSFGSSSYFRRTAAAPSILSSSSKRLVQGCLFCQDIGYAGAIQGASRFDMQSVVNAPCSLALGRLALSKALMPAVDTLYSRVLPFH